MRVAEAAVVTGRFVRFLGDLLFFRIRASLIPHSLLLVSCPISMQTACPGSFPLRNYLNYLLSIGEERILLGHESKEAESYATL